MHWLLYVVPLSLYFVAIDIWKMFYIIIQRNIFSSYFGLRKKLKHPLPRMLKKCYLKIQDSPKQKLMAHNSIHPFTVLFKMVHPLCRNECILEKHCYGHWTNSSRNWCNSRGNSYGFFITNISHQFVTSGTIWILSHIDPNMHWLNNVDIEI